MKEYIIKVNKNKIESESIKLVQNDYNSTKLLFDFDFVEDYKKVFQMKLPSGATWIKEIINNELILSDENNTETVPVLVENGLYEYDIAIYNDNSKLTTTDKAYLTVRSEIKGENVELDDRTPILDDLINETRNAVNEADNLDIDIENSVVTITKKDGTVKTENVKGDKGDKGDPGVIKMLFFASKEELPETGSGDTLYFVKVENPTTTNYYQEYAWVNKGTEEEPNWDWEDLGGAILNVDLTNYVKNTDYATTDKGGVVMVKEVYGTRMVGGTLDLMPAQYSEIDSRNPNEYPLYMVNNYTRHMIVPATIDYSVKETFTNNKLVGTAHEWTEEDKTKALELLGAVKRTTGSREIYGNDWQGNLTTYRVDYPNDATVNGIPVRAANGAIQINDESCEDGGSGSILEGTQAVNKNYVKKYVDSRHVALTQAEYDELVAKGTYTREDGTVLTYSDDVFYYIVEE